MRYVKAYKSTVTDEVIRAGMRALALLRWSKATPEQKAEQARRMVAGQRKARKHRQAKGAAK